MNTQKKKTLYLYILKNTPFFHVSWIHILALKTALILKSRECTQLFDYTQSAVTGSFAHVETQFIQCAGTDQLTNYYGHVLLN